MNPDGLNALVNQVGFEFDGSFIVTDDTSGENRAIQGPNFETIKQGWGDLIRIWSGNRGSGTVVPMCTGGLF